MMARRVDPLTRSLRGPAVLLCMLALGGDLLAAQQVTVLQRDTSWRRDSVVIRADSIFLRFSTAEPEELLRQVTLLREREARLLTELRATPSANVALQRQLADQLAQLSRESFTLMSLVESRCATERGPRPEGYLGITLSSPAEVSAGRVRSIGRAAVESVDPGSPAQRGGIAAGDLIVSIAGRDFRRDIPYIDDLLQVGNRLGVRVERDGLERDLTVTVGRRAQNVDRSCGQFERVLQPLRMMGPGRILVESTGDGRTRRVEVRAAPSPTRDVRVVPTPDQERSFFIFAPGAAGVTDIAFFGGAEFRPLSNDWREVLGMARGTTGVIVSEVAPGSMAAQAGLREGDVITGVGGANATSPEVLVRLLSVSAQRDATLRVVRGKSTKTVVLPTSRP
jgi:hypothetical protein